MKKKKERHFHVECFIKDITVGFMYALPILVIILSAFRTGLQERAMYADFVATFTFNPIFEVMKNILDLFEVDLVNNNLSLCLAVFSWFVFVGLMDCVYDVFAFLIEMFQSLIHRGY